MEEKPGVHLQNPASKSLNREKNEELGTTGGISVNIIERQERVEKVNQLLMAIGCCGRKFFHTDEKFSHFELDNKGKIWYIDKWSGKRIYTHYPNWMWNHKITEGGTLKSMLKDLQKFIMDGVPIPNHHLGKWPKSMCNGDPWGYGKDMELVRTKAKALKIWIKLKTITIKDGEFKIPNKYQKEKRLHIKQPWSSRVITKANPPKRFRDSLTIHFRASKHGDQPFIPEGFMEINGERFKVIY